MTGYALSVTLRVPDPAVSVPLANVPPFVGFPLFDSESRFNLLHLAYTFVILLCTSTGNQYRYERRARVEYNRASDSISFL